MKILEMKLSQLLKKNEILEMKLKSKKSDIESLEYTKNE